MKETATFLRRFARQPARVGAVAPSSRELVATMVESIDWEWARYVVEFGPGTGVFTAEILRSLHNQADFFAIERCATFAAATRRRCPSATVYEACAADVHALCNQHGMPQVDAVISGLPWASLTTRLQTEILDSLLQVLSPQGQFATFAYCQGVMLPSGRKFADLLHQHFSQVQKSRIVWRNVPPAFVYRCRR